MSTSPKRALLLGLNSALHKDIAQHEPAKFVEDNQGRPLAMLAGRVSTGVLAGATFLRSEIEGAGLSPDDVPNLTIVEDGA